MSTLYAPHRRPLDLDVHDDDAVRAWLARLVSDQVITRREPIPAIHLLHDGHEEVLEWTSVLQQDPGADLAATWAELGKLRGPDRRILILRFEHESGTNEACVFEQVWEDGAPVAWWFGRRAYVVEEGIGRMTGAAWHQWAGEGEPPEPFASLLAPAPGARPVKLLPARAPEAAAWMQSGQLPEGAAGPKDALEMTAHCQSLVLSQLERQGLQHLLLQVIRGRVWEVWLLGDDLPTSPDDMIRWVCARGPTPDAVATAEGVIAQLNGASERMIRIVGEMGGRRAERAVVMKPKPGKPEDVVPDRAMWRDLGPVGDDGWIGVAPLLAGEITLRPLGYGPPR